MSASVWGRPRAGAFALAGAAALYLVLDVVGDMILKGPDGYKRYETISWMYYAGAALDLGAIALIAGAPKAVRASRLAWIAFGAYAAREVVFVARRIFMAQLLQKYGYERWSTTTLAFTLPASVLAIAGTILVFAALARIARGAGVRVPGVVFAIVPTIATANSLVGIASMLGSRSLGDSLGAARTVAAYAFLGLELAVCAWLGVALKSAKEPEGEPAKEPGDREISAEWRGASDALGLYLGGAFARVAIAVLSFATMAGASGSSSLSDLRSVRDTVVLMALVGAMASLVMIGALLKFSRAPDERVHGPATFAALCAIAGLILDGVTTSITASALGGDLSAAFFAMDALPWLVVGAVTIGITAGVALATALAAAASHLGNTDAERAAKSVRVLIVPAGVLLALSQSMGRHPPEGVVVFMIVLGLPLALAAVVRLLQAIFGVRATVAARLKI